MQSVLQLSGQAEFSGQEYQHLLQHTVIKPHTDKTFSPVVRPGLGVNTFVEIVVEHQAVSAAELLGSGGELADDVLPAGGGVGEGGMGQRDSVRSNGFTVWTFEALDVGFRRVLLTLACEGGCLFFSDTGALGLVEHKGRGAVVRVGEAVDAVVVPAGRATAPRRAADTALTCCKPPGPHG